MKMIFLWTDVRTYGWEQTLSAIWNYGKECVCVTAINGQIIQNGYDNQINYHLIETAVNMCNTQLGVGEASSDNKCYFLILAKRPRQTAVTSDIEILLKW